MQLQKAIEDALQILHEERLRPTIGYEDNYDDLMERVGQDRANAILAALRRIMRPNLTTLRKQRPRDVVEFPETYVFGGTNYRLLMTLFERLSLEVRDGLLKYLMKLVEVGGQCSPAPGLARFPAFLGRVSDLPLIAEFSIRTGYVQKLVDALNKVKAPTPAIALMMTEIEELIAINFHFLSDADLLMLGRSLDPLRQMAESHEGGDRRTAKQTLNTRSAREIGFSIQGIQAECRQARYFYLKGMLQQEKPNLESESDRKQVIDFLDTLGFDPLLKRTLEQAEKEYRDAANPFELKNCLGHLRGFLEHLHRRSAKAVAAAKGETVKDAWGDATSYLHAQGIFAKKQEEFVTALYALISDTGVHPLGADREYARLLRNVVIEYGVMFLSALDRNGVKVA
jgi:hypothetical protein